ncbi:unnamed protein product [Mycena citricolor]|uniref:FAD dependent oxidoreductase domain-containing protein n=1 Tax=Mycena citricolor TaxID=2018698 RepID=A0AAD2K0Z2_9AGAR|nr:unnamed protein product [Mycena citricolor]
MSTATAPQHVFVVGAGVIGLSTAIRAIEAGFAVSLVAETFPVDPKSIKYTSCWAGANHISLVDMGERLHGDEMRTGPQMLVESEPDVPVMIGPNRVHVQVLSADAKATSDHFTRFYSDYRLLGENELPPGMKHGGEFTTASVPRLLSIHPVLRGGHAYRATLPSLTSLFTPSARPPFEPIGSEVSPPTAPFDAVAVFNCTGLGALTLGDVMDSAMYPTRGETILLRAPWIKAGFSLTYEDGHRTYVIPRKSGDVVLGGTFQPNDWHPTSRPETVKLIKERGIYAHPELLPEEKRANGSIDDLDVIEECVGLRTSRVGGVRVEMTSLDIAGDLTPVVHNYGHGGCGYQSSWGSAEAAVAILLGALQKDNQRQ